METKKIPLGVVMLLLILGLFAYLGVVCAADQLGRWRAELNAVYVPWVIISALFSVVSLLAILDLLRRSLSGLYLGLLPLLAVWGGALRFVTKIHAGQFGFFGNELQVFERMASVGFVIALGVFIIKLGFGKAIADYFRSE